MVTAAISHTSPMVAAVIPRMPTIERTPVTTATAADDPSEGRGHGVLSIVGMGDDGRNHRARVADGGGDHRILLALYLIGDLALGGPVIPALAVVGLAAISIPLGVGGFGARSA